MTFHLSKLFHTKSGRYIISAILGFGLATFFRAACKNNKCLVFKAPPKEEVDGVVFQHDGKCYEYTPHSVKCDKSKKLVNL